jgi:hypothetical protein
MHFPAAMFKILPDVILDFHSLPTAVGVNMLNPRMGGLP